MKTNRRQFIGGIGALAASTFPMPAFAQAKPKVVVVGGGPGGATVAKYVAKDGGLDVTLVEPARAVHHLLPLQSLSRRLQDLRVDHPFLRQDHQGLRHQARPPDARRRSTATRRRCKLAERHARCPTTGSCSRPASTSSSTRCPAIRRRPARSCRTPGRPAPQTQLLKRQLNALSDGATIVMIAPPNPVPLPARALRARLDDGARAQGQGPQEVAHHRPRPEGELLQAGRCSWRAGRSTTPAWSSGRTRRCTAASRASTPRR